MQVSGNNFINVAISDKKIFSPGAETTNTQQNKTFSQDNISIVNTGSGIKLRPQENLSALFNSEQIVKELENATEGLLFMSESDYPFTGQLFKGEGSGFNTAILLNLIDAPEDTLIEVLEPEEFFENVANEQDWHSEAQKAEVPRYQNLLKLLKENLNNVKVYRVGEVEIKTYIIGTSKDGKDIAGLSTIQIET